MAAFSSSQSDLLHSFTNSGYFLRPPALLEKQLAFYGAYHSVFGNQVVHFIFVPFLLISGTSLSYILIGNFFDLSLAFYHWLFIIGWSLIYPLTYIYIDFIGGLSWIPMAIITWKSSQYVVNSFSTLSVLAFFVISFGIQIVSHYVIEKRKPAFLDAIYQSLVLAPFFIWFELCIFPFGFYAETRERVEHRVKKLQKAMDTALTPKEE